MLCFAIVVVGWIVSLCFHEYGHARVAYSGGDTTVLAKGYLSLNPLKYVHPVLSIGLPLLFLILGGIPLPGGAVYINDGLLRSRGWRTAVSLAGPGMNILTGLLFASAFMVGWFEPSQANSITNAFALLVFFEVYSVILNLIPVPPLDGFGAIAPWLPSRWSEQAYRRADLWMIAFFIVLWNVPEVSGPLQEATVRIISALGVDFTMVLDGFREFQFWKKG